MMPNECSVLKIEKWIKKVDNTFLAKKQLCLIPSSGIYTSMKGTDFCRVSCKEVHQTAHKKS